MSEPQTISWIFLATAIASQIEPAKFSDISQIADGINHAVPTHKELQTSVSWLLNNNLIIKDGNKYTLSELGRSVYESSQDNSIILLKMWNNLEVEIKRML